MDDLLARGDDADTMPTKTLWVVLSMLLAGSGCSSESESATESMGLAAATKVAICHISPDEPGQQHTIVVSANALQSHLAHGDTLGECGECEDAGTPQDCRQNGCGASEYCAACGSAYTCIPLGSTC